MRKTRLRIGRSNEVNFQHIHTRHHSSLSPQHTPQTFHRLPSLTPSPTKKIADEQFLNEIYGFSPPKTDEFKIKTLRVALKELFYSRVDLNRVFAEWDTNCTGILELSEL